MSGDGSLSQRPAGTWQPATPACFGICEAYLLVMGLSITHKTLGRERSFFWPPKAAARGGNWYFWGCRLPHCPSQAGGYTGSSPVELVVRNCHHCQQAGYTCTKGYVSRPLHCHLCQLSGRASVPGCHTQSQIRKNRCIKG